MREIKFRVWNPKRAEMLFIKNIWVDFEKIAQQHIDGVLNLHILKLMQYTGLKDKNNKEIYEGDIVKAGKFNYEVIWHNDTASFGCIPIQQIHSITTTKALFEVLEFFDAEIIGNRYENPKLLEEK